MSILGVDRFSEEVSSLPTLASVGASSPRPSLLGRDYSSSLAAAEVLYSSLTGINSRDIPEVHDSMLMVRKEEDDMNKKKPVKTFVEHPPCLEDGSRAEILSVEFLKQYLKFCRCRRGVWG